MSMPADHCSELMKGRREKFGAFVRRERLAKEIGLREMAKEDWGESDLSVEGGARRVSPAGGNKVRGKPGPELPPGFAGG